MKKLIVLMAMLFVLFFSVPSFAGNNNNQNNWDVNTGPTITNTLQANPTATATANNSVRVDPIVQNSGNVNNTNNINNDVNNTNLNLGINAQKQGQTQDQNQDQVQLQVQDQGQDQDQNQSQTATANNSGNTQNVEINQNYEAKRDYLAGPNLLKPDPKFTLGKNFELKVFGSVLPFVDIVAWDDAVKLGDDCDDVTINYALLFEQKYHTDKIDTRVVTGKFMGYIYIYPDGKDVTMAGMEGKAMEAAMYAGATSIVFVKRGAGIIADGDAWNIGLGGGASIINNKDSLAVAPNAGLGFGNATAYNEARPEMVVAVFYDATKVNTEKTKRIVYFHNHH